MRREVKYLRVKNLFESTATGLTNSTLSLLPPSLTDPLPYRNKPTKQPYFSHLIPSIFVLRLSLASWLNALLRRICVIVAGALLCILDPVNRRCRWASKNLSLTQHRGEQSCFGWC